MTHAGGERSAIDHAYDPFLTIPDAAERIAATVHAGAVAFAGADVRPALRYEASADEYLDLYPVAAASPAPVHMFLHGGFWRAFSARDYAFVAPPLQRAGVLTAVVNYALCPHVTIAQIVEQCRRAFVWIWRNAAQHGGDARRISVSGHSAGGHLAAMLAATDWTAYDLPRDPIAAIVPVSGLFDIAPLAQSWLQPVLRIDPPLGERCSPLRLTPAARTPALVVVGERETPAFRDQSARYGAMLTSHGITTEALTLVGHDHLSILREFGTGGVLAARIAAIAHDRADHYSAIPRQHA